MFAWMDTLAQELYNEQDATMFPPQERHPLAWFRERIEQLYADLCNQLAGHHGIAKLIVPNPPPLVYNAVRALIKNPGDASWQERIRRASCGEKSLDDEE